MKPRLLASLLPSEELHLHFRELKSCGWETKTALESNYIRMIKCYEKTQVIPFDQRIRDKVPPPHTPEFTGGDIQPLKARRSHAAVNPHTRPAV